jgi:serine protease
VSADPSEDVVVPASAGGYFVRVTAVSGASNYVLSIGGGARTTGLPRRAKRLSDPFVPGELLLATGDRPVVGRFRLEGRPRGRLYALSAVDRGPTPELRIADVGLPAGATASPATLIRYRTLLAAKAAAGHDEVELAELNVLRRPLARVPNDELYRFQWHYGLIGLEAAWEVSTGQDTGHPPVVVAVVDTGVRLDHPDLSGQWLRDAQGRVVGYDFIQDAERAVDGDGVDPDPNDPGDSGSGDGTGSFHGTHVAGTVAAESDNGIGVAGVSWGARLMPLRALGVDGGTTFDVMQAVRYAAGLSNASGALPPVRADVVNLSLGSDFYSEAEQRTLNEVRAQGVFVVASAGNEDSDVPSYPASYDGVISVAAVTRAGTRAGYSNVGPFVDVAAPGGDGLDRDSDGRPDGVASTIGGGADYGILQGTSMAAPHVAGVIALMKSVYPRLTPSEFDDLLARGQLTEDAGLTGRDDEFGWGILNANKAVQAALAAQSSQDDSLGPVLSISTSTLNFQSFTRELDFSVSNVGNQDVTVQVTDDQDWLTVSPLGSAVDGLGPYRVTVDRTNLSDGSYSGLITITPDNPSVTPRSIRVAMRVTSPDLQADAGQHYVILVNVEDDSSAAVATVTADGGVYPFDLDDVAPGRYQLFAGTDLDDDDFICDGGEACGAYPSLSSPEVIVIEPAVQPLLDGLEFASEFRTTATTTANGNADGRSGARPRDGIPLPRPTRPGTTGSD